MARGPAPGVGPGSPEVLHFPSIQRVDDVLSAGGFAACSVERLLQGPFSDALTHAGQLLMLRRMAGSPVRGENYFRADIAAGQLGPVPL